MDDEAIYGIRSLWLELTNFCNLECIHCYNESVPHINRSLELTYADYSTVLASASALNCKDVHFLGVNLL